MIQSSTTYNYYLDNAYLFKKLINSNTKMKLCGITSYDANAYKFIELLEEIDMGKSKKKKLGNLSHVIELASDILEHPLVESAISKVSDKTMGTYVDKKGTRRSLSDALRGEYLSPEKRRELEDDDEE